MEPGDTYPDAPEIGGRLWIIPRIVDCRNASVSRVLLLAAVLAVLVALGFGCSSSSSLTTSQPNQVASLPAGAGEWTSTPLSANGPPVRLYESAVYLDSIQMVFMFGGGGREFNGSPPQLFNDTWTYDPATGTWKQLKPVGSLPDPRWRHSTAYDPDTDQVFLLGGDDAEKTANAGNSLDDLWVYDVARDSWTQLHPLGDRPQPRESAAFMYDKTARKLLLFGGSRASGDYIVYQDDIWSYDPVVNKWEELHPSGTRSSPRTLPQMVFDSRLGLTILFGGFIRQNLADGQAASDTVVTDFWSFDYKRNVWTRLTGKNEVPTLGHLLCWAPSQSLVVLFRNDSAGDHGMWWFDPSTGKSATLGPAGTAPPLIAYMSAVSCDAKGILIWGGVLPEGLTSSQPLVYGKTMWLWRP